MSSDVAPHREWVLQPESEYRFELEAGSSLAIKLVRGLAEIFGAEMVEGKTYVFGFECKAAVFTWQGCTLEVTGQPAVEYVSEETPMAAYANLHVALEQMRVRALAAIHGSPISDYGESSPTFSDPPRVLVLGPENSGKTTVCKILANYAVSANQGWAPTLINVDPGTGAWTIPGTVSAVSLSVPIGTYSPAAQLGTSATTLPMHLSSNTLLPLVYWYGHTAIQRNPLLLDRLIRNLGENVADRGDHDAEGRSSGLIVDTPASFAATAGKVTGKANDSRLSLIKACVEAFRINVIVVVGHEKLNVDMQRAYGDRVTVVKIPKSGGVVELDTAYRERTQVHQLHTYMYGEVIKPPEGITSYTLGGDITTDLLLAPLSAVVPFGDLSLFRIGEETMAPSSALPIGATRAVSEMQPIPVDPATPGSGLVNSVLALLSSPNPDEAERYDEEVLDLTVVGFLVITALDVGKRAMTVLGPGQQTFSGKTAIVGSLEWTDPV